MSYAILQNQTSRPLLFLLVQSADHLSPATGLVPTVTISKNGGAFSSPAGALTEVGSGWYQVAGNAADANTLGPLLLHATATGADVTDERYEVVAYNPDSANLGLTNLDAAVSSRASQASIDTIDDFLDTEMAATLAAVDTEIAAILTRLPAALVSGRRDSSVGACAAGVLTAAALATDAVLEIADGLLDRDMATGTDSGSDTVRTVRQALRILRNRHTALLGVLRVYKEDDTTESWNAALTTSAAAELVTEVNPEG